MSTNSSLPPGARVAGYARDSGGRAQELSTEQQIAAITTYCQDHQLTLSRMFVDAAQSGKSTVSRRAFLDLVDYLPDAPEQAVVIWSYSRFARQYDDIQFYLAMLRRAGKQIISVTDPVPDTLEGRLLESITAYKDAKFRADMGRDIRRGQRYVVERFGVRHGGRVPLGYSRVPLEIGSHRDGTARRIHKYEPNADAEIVRQAYELRASGMGIGRICRILPAMGGITTARQILRNVTYTGRVTYGDLVVENAHPAIIDQELWDAVQQVNQARSHRMGPHHPRSVPSSYLLSGLLICDLCGYPMVGAPGAYHPYYRCQSATRQMTGCPASLIRTSALDEIILGIVRQHVTDPAIIADIQAAADRIAVQDRPDTSAQQRARVQSQINNILSAIRDIGHSATLLTELTRLESELASIKPPQPVKRIDVSALADRIAAVIDSNPRSAVSGLVQEIRVARTKSAGLHGICTLRIADEIIDVRF